MNRIMQDQPITIFGDGEQTRAFSYIEDVAPVIACAVEVPEAYGKVFNVGASQPYTVNYLAEVVAKAMGKPASIRCLPSRKEVKHAFSDHTKIMKVFGPLKTTSLEEGIQRMANWALKVGSRKSHSFKNIEIEKNLPPSWLE